MEKLIKIGLSLPILAMFILLALAPYLISGNEYLIHMLAVSLMFGTLAMGFDISVGFIGVANWGYAGLMGLGAYTSALLLINFGISPWIGMIAGGVLAALLGLIIGALTFRMGGMYASVLAWFFGLVLMSLTSALPGLTLGVIGLYVDLFFETPWSTPYFYVILFISVIIYTVLQLVVRSNMGLVFKALGQDVEAARASGVDPMKYKAINFTISSFIAGLCGGVYAHFIGVLTPELMSTSHVIEILTITYIGGRGSIWGSLIAALLIIPIFEYLNFLMEYKFLIYGIMLLMVMIFYPSGIAGLFATTGNKWVAFLTKKQQLRRKQQSRKRVVFIE